MVGDEHDVLDDENRGDEHPVAPDQAQYQHGYGYEEFHARVGTMQPTVAGNIQIGVHQRFLPVLL